VDGFVTKAVETERPGSLEDLWRPNPGFKHGAVLRSKGKTLSTQRMLVDDMARRSQARLNWLLGTVPGMLIAILYWPVLVSLVRQWHEDPNYSHGFLIPVLSGYFVYERRHRFAALSLSPTWWGFPVLLIGALMLILGHVGAELFLQRLSLLVVISGVVLMIAGSEVMRVCSFPLAFLLFMIPLPTIVLNAVAFPLQLFAAQTAEASLLTLDIPVLREGNVISLANTTLEVAEACSGIRSLMALIALGTVYAYFSERTMWKRWVIIIAAVPVAIAANAFRVAGTGVLAHYFGDDAAQGFYHDFSGWLVFVVAFVLLLGIGLVLRRMRYPATPSPQVDQP
jgi:exosortase